MSFDMLDARVWHAPKGRVDKVTLLRRFTGGYIPLTPADQKTFLRVLVNQVTQDQLLFNSTPVFIEIRRKGCEDEVMLARYDAFQRDANGYLGFYWDEGFLGLPSGFYVGDVYINCCYCFSVNFRLAPCEAVIDDFYTTDGIETCAAGMCAPVVVMGMETIGGTDCPTDSAGACGNIAPYFEDGNPNPSILGDVCFDVCDGPTPVTNPPNSFVGTIGD